MTPLTTPGDPPVLTALRKACGRDHVRAAGIADAVHGASPGWVAAPATTEEVGEVMRVAAEYSLRVVPRGGGSKLDWGVPPRSVDLVLDTGRLTGIVEHAAGDLVLVVRAGTRLDALADAVGAAGQRLALDDVGSPPATGGTVGGALATNASGPLRLLYGTPRDLLIGITVVRPDGVVARSGGKVVKNVAGYDLGKLFAGSYGTLGVITEAVFRLHPVPPARAFRQRLVNSPTQAGRLAQALTHSQLAPAALELDWPSPHGPGTLAVLLEGHPDGLGARSEAAAELLETSEAAVSAGPPPAWWGRYPGDQHDVIFKFTFPVALLPVVLHTLHTAAAGYHLAPACRGSVGSGVLYVGLGPGWEVASVGELLGDLRAGLADQGVNVTVLRAPPTVAATVDVWGPVPAVELMRRVKDQFDPEHRCAPGRFVGGI